MSNERHAEDKLGGVVEAALNNCMNNEEWLALMAIDPNIEQSTETEVFRALEAYIVEHLARI